MRISLRFKILLAVLFALTVLACFDVRSPSSEVVKAVDSTSRPKGSAATDSKQSTKSVMILALQSRSRSDEQKEINAFLQRDWTPPPPPPPPHHHRLRLHKLLLSRSPLSGKSLKENSGQSFLRSRNARTQSRLVT